MIIISDLLPARAPNLYRRLTEWSALIGVDLHIQPDTKDIWIRDYYPIPLGKGKAVSFRYEPSYLRGRYSHLKTTIRSTPWCDEVILSDLIVDGGNVELTDDAVLITDRIFSENPNRTRTNVTSEIEDIFQRTVYIFPSDPDDPTGHIDGMLACVGNVLFINDYSRWPDLESGIMRSAEVYLKDHPNITVVRLPYHPGRSTWSAVGNYVNLIAMGRNILVPQYGLLSDDVACATIAQELPGHICTPAVCNEIASEGGALHCVTANLCVKSINH